MAPGAADGPPRALIAMLARMLAARRRQLKEWPLYTAWHWPVWAPPRRPYDWRTDGW